ncbi:hypothetical protein Salat_1844800 [Sesamum alatum]|uniref:Reverse transcriptase zinc-binding domain-containing protein n=1 Tax=Sesamum alatum TaxID=300844 RepID=A0AAE1Y3X8_9LAMI|nr:hypothetical protein Salat_1844800 [Sesamum alatum]
MECVSYAHILVEVHASKKLVDSVEFILPNGVTRKQPVVYEYTPKFCSDCSKFGHLKDSCQGSQPQVAAPTVPVKQSTPIGSKKALPGEWTMKQVTQAVNEEAQGQPKTSQPQQGMTAPMQHMPSKQPKVEPVGLSNSDDESSTATQHLMLTGHGINIATPRDLKQKQKYGGVPALIPHEYWVLECEGLQPAPQTQWKNSLAFHPLGTSLRTSPIVAYHSDFMMPLLQCKLDRVLLNNEWPKAGLHCNAHFNPPGCLFGHSPGIVSILDLPASKSKPFRFFNMKLKALKGPLKAFNNLHFSHISVRAKETDLALQDAQLQLESNPGNSVIRDSLRELRKKAVFLAEAERHFYYQKAKIHFLKRNAAKSSIMAISKSNGSTITSAEDIGREFVAYFTSLLGTEVRTLPVDNDVFEWELKLSTEHEFRDISGLAVNTSKVWSAFGSKSSPFQQPSLRKSTSWNVALLARVLWNIHRKADTLWVQWVNSVYVRGGSIWEWHLRKGDSPFLQRLAEIRNRLITDFGSAQAAIQHMNEWSNCKGLVTSKAYEYFRLKLMRQPWKTTIWNTFIPSKYSFILWLGIQGRLATRDRLAFPQEKASCSLYINTNESAKHLFFECPFSVCVWSDIRQWLGINQRMSTILSAVKWLKKEKIGSSV